MVKNKNDNKKQLKFEEALNRLERIVDSLEAGNIPLEESLKLYEEGVRLIRFLSGKLEKAETKIEKLLEGKDGSAILEEYNLFSDETGDDED